MDECDSRVPMPWVQERTANVVLSHSSFLEQWTGVATGPGNRRRSRQCSAWASCFRLTRCSVQVPVLQMRSQAEIRPTPEQEVQGVSPRKMEEHVRDQQATPCSRIESLLQGLGLVPLGFAFRSFATDFAPSVSMYSKFGRSRVGRRNCNTPDLVQRNSGLFCSPHTQCMQLLIAAELFLNARV